MAGKDIIRMKPEEIKRINVIHQTIDKRVTQVEAGIILSLSILKIALRNKKIRHRAIAGSDTPIKPKYKNARSALSRSGISTYKFFFFTFSF